MLTDLKTLLGLKDDTKDDVLTLILQNVEDDAVRKTGCADRFFLRSVILDMAIYRFNRLGSEGLTKEDYAGLSYTYSDDYPEYILSALDTIKTSQKGKGGFKILW